MKTRNVRLRQWERYLRVRDDLRTAHDRLTVPRGWLRFDGVRHRVRDRQYLMRRGLS